MKAVRFAEALQVAAQIATANSSGQHAIRIVRDVYGRLRFAINVKRSEFPLELREALVVASEDIGAFLTSKEPLFVDDFSDAGGFFSHPDWHQTTVTLPADEDRPEEELSVDVLDRQIIGQDWLHTVQDEAAGKPPTVVFYGLKGGVGRSTALAMLAYTLAREGKRVLLLDFDLESPGLSGLLLPADRVATYGLVDWFIEDGVGQAEGVLDDLVSDSPLADHLTGEIVVAACMGRDETDYLAKLARIYADIPSPRGRERFAERMIRVVNALTLLKRPDIVLIDSRAGLHDLAAISIAMLSDLSLLFATDSAQTWQGYRQLFSHWRQRPKVLRHVRNRLSIVRAMFPETEQENGFRRFLEQSYDLFANALYDEVVAGSVESPDSFTFDLESEGAPHFPLIVRWSARFLEFNALLPVERGGIGDSDIDLAFGPFADRVKAIVFET